MPRLSLNQSQIEELMVEVITGKKLFSPEGSDVPLKWSLDGE